MDADIFDPKRFLKSAGRVLEIAQEQVPGIEVTHVAVDTDGAGVYGGSFSGMVGDEDRYYYLLLATPEALQPASDGFKVWDDLDYVHGVERVFPDEIIWQVPWDLVCFSYDVKDGVIGEGYEVTD